MSSCGPWSDHASTFSPHPIHALEGTPVRTSADSTDRSSYRADIILMLNRGLRRLTVGLQSMKPLANAARSASMKYARTTDRSPTGQYTEKVPHADELQSPEQAICHCVLLRPCIERHHFCSAKQTAKRVGRERGWFRARHTVQR
jgi:hypothetical protein